MKMNLEQSISVLKQQIYRIEGRLGLIEKSVRELEWRAFGLNKLRVVKKNE